MSGMHAGDPPKDGMVWSDAIGWYVPAAKPTTISKSITVFLKDNPRTADMDLIERLNKEADRMRLSSGAAPLLEEAASELAYLRSQVEERKDLTKRYSETLADAVKFNKELLAERHAARAKALEEAAAAADQHIGRHGSIDDWAKGFNCGAADVAAAVRALLVSDHSTAAKT